VPRPPSATLFPYTTLFRSLRRDGGPARQLTGASSGERDRTGTERSSAERSETEQKGRTEPRRGGRFTKAFAPPRPHRKRTSPRCRPTSLPPVPTSGAALPQRRRDSGGPPQGAVDLGEIGEHTSELQSRENLVCRLLLEKK